MHYNSIKLHLANIPKYFVTAKTQVRETHLYVYIIIIIIIRPKINILIKNLN